MGMNGEKKEHKILGRPVLGAIVLMLFATCVCFQLCGLLSLISEMLTVIVSVIVSLGIMFLYKYYFKDELKSIASLSFLSDRNVLMAIIIFEIADVAVAAMGWSRSGFSFPSLVMFLGCIMAGVGEEVVYRLLPVSIMMRAYKDRNKYLPALLLPAIVFGLSHFQNMLAGASMEQTMIQVVGSSVAGLFFVAIYLRTGNIVVPILSHFLHDLLNSMIGGVDSFVMNAPLTKWDFIDNGIIAIVQIALVVWLLKGHKDEIIAKWKELWNTGA